jgi:hypothetical protein
MKKGILVLVLAIVAGVAAYCLMRSHKVEASRGALLDKMPELTWIRSDLKLTDSEFAKVTELHLAYRPKCMEMCDRVYQSHERLDKAIQSSEGLTAELKAAISDHAKIHGECQEAMVEHLYRTAAVLDKDQAKRYLNTMLPYALDFSHSEPEQAHGH